MKTQLGDSKEHASIGKKVILLGSVALLFAAFLNTGTAAGASYNNVQVFASTTSTLPYSFTFTAYNMTGGLVASYQSSFPAAAFELPDGEYLFTVSAVEQNYYPCYELCPMQGGVATGTGETAPSIAMPYRSPASEYGYTMASVTSSQTLNINLVNVTQYPTSDVTVRVSYVNGTAVDGASVSASVVGQWYYWWGDSGGVSMWGQTDSSGVVTLVLPRAPAVVTAWKWVEVDLPAKNATVTTDVGGQQIEVIVYWQPTYVGLSASGLAIPPASNVNLTLRYQQPDYWVVPMGVEYAQAQGGTGSAMVANQASATPAIASQPSQQGQQYYLPNQIPQVQSGSSSAGASSGVPLSWATAIGAAGALLGAVSTFVFLGRRKGPSGAVP